MDVNPGADHPAVGEPDDRDLDDGGLDLSPRTGAEGSRSAKGRRWGALGVLALLAGSLVFIAVQARGASLFFLNADEAVAQQAELGGSSFRLQGQVSGTPLRGEGNEPTRFTVTYNDVDVDVTHTGSEPALFKEGLPVVAEGHWSADGAVFESNRLLVKHTEEYRSRDDGDYDEDHPDRVEVESAEGGSG